MTAVAARNASHTESGNVRNVMFPPSLEAVSKVWAEASRQLSVAQTVLESVESDASVVLAFARGAN